MAARSIEEAVDAFLDPIRTTPGCLTPYTAFGSGRAPGQIHAITAFATGRSEPYVLRLPTHGGAGEILIRFFLHYVAVPLPAVEGRRRYETRTVGYQYRLLDIAIRDLAAYDWRPDGNSPVTTPHLHVPGAEPVAMAQRPGSPREGAKTHLGKVHFPTRHIFPEDVVELLIRDFAVVPARPDWQAVLQENREAIARGRTWQRLLPCPPPSPREASRPVSTCETVDVPELTAGLPAK